MPPPNEAGILEVSFSQATVATHEVLAAVAAKRHYIYAVWLWANGIVTVTLQTAATPLAGPMAMIAQSRFDKDFNVQNIPWFTCAAGEAFNIQLGHAIQVSGRVYYKTY